MSETKFCINNNERPDFVGEVSFCEDISHKQLLIYFARSNNDTISKIRQAIYDNDVKLAHRLAHTLKGNAGQIGETQLREISASVEGSLKESNVPAAVAQMGDLDVELQKVLDKFAPLVAEDDKKIRIEITDSAKVIEILEELEPMLIKRNPESMNMLDDIRMIPGAEELAQLVEDFDFKPALNELKKLKGRF